MSTVVAIELTGAEKLIAAFVEIERTVGDFSPIFEEIGPEVLTDIRQRIDSHPGPPLAASTVKRKGSTKILRDKDDLYASFQKGAGANVFRITPLAAEFGTSDFKAMFHQTGTGRMPQRTIIEITGEHEARYAKIAVGMLNARFREIGFEVTT